MFYKKRKLEGYLGDGRRRRILMRPGTEVRFHERRDQAALFLLAETCALHKLWTFYLHEDAAAMENVVDIGPKYRYGIHGF